MTHLTSEELTYLDVGWFAADARGKIAVLFSGGTNNLVRSPATTREGADTIFDCVEELPLSTEAMLDDDTVIRAVWSKYVPAHIDLEYARRGFYVYDALRYVTLDPNKYIRIASPRQPIFLDDLDEEVGELLRTVQGQSVDFNSARFLNILDISGEITDRG